MEIKAVDAAGADHGSHSCDHLARAHHPVNIPDKQNWDQDSVGAPCLHRLTALPPSLHAKWDSVFI